MSLNDTFDIEDDTCTTVVQSPVQVVCTPTATKQEENTIVEYDYQSARNNLYSILQQGEEALLHALEVAKAKEEPRAFEVVGGLLKQLSDINTQLLDLSEKKQKIMEKEKKEIAPTSPTNVTNNAIFVGSTDELNKMLNKMRGNIE